MSVSQRILIVEDDPEQAALFRAVLTMGSYEIVTVASAEEALEQLASAVFTLVLADWNLPGMTGDELLAIVKLHYPHVKTILFSNHTDVDQACDRCGADAWFRKIEGVASLRQLVAELVPTNTQP